MGQGIAHHAHDQVVRDDGLAIQAEGQQRPLRQPRQRRVHQVGGHLGPVAAGRQHTRPPGVVQQLPADSPGRQHRRDLHDPGTHPGPVTGPDRVEGQHDGLGHAMRIRLSFLPGQARGGRHGPQPAEVGPVSQVVRGDHARGLGQCQRQVTQLAGQGPRSRGIRETGPLGQERQRLIGGEHVNGETGPQAGHRPQAAGDQHPRRAARGKQRPYPVRVQRVVEHHQAAAPVAFQPVPHRPSRIAAALAGAAIGQPQLLGQRGQASPQHRGICRVDPGHQPPAGG